MYTVLVILFLILAGLSVAVNMLVAKVALKHGVQLKRKFLFYTDTQDLISKMQETKNEDLKKSLSNVLKMKIGVKALQMIAVITFIFYIFSR